MALPLPTEPTPAMRAAYALLLADPVDGYDEVAAARWSLLVDEADPVEWANRLLALSRALRAEP